MYGVMFDLLRSYTIDRHGGRAAWDAVLKQAGFGYRMYFPVAEYPDEELVTLVIALSRAQSQSLQAVLEDYGHYLGPKLLQHYQMLIQPHWRTFEVLENTGSRAYPAVQKHNAKCQPPELHAQRLSPDQLTLTYRSERKMCAVAKGIVRGLADHFGESIAIRETACLLSGADRCEFELAHTAAG